MRGKIAVIGSSNTDMIVKVPEIPKPGETVIGGEFFKASGGKGANQAVAAARAGADVTFVARVGNDEFGRTAIENYKKEGINTDYVIIDKEKPSGVAFIFVDQNGENSIAVASGANNNLKPSDIEKLKELINTVDIILLQLEIPLKTVEAVVNIAYEKGKKIILNPAPAQKLSDSLLGKITILTPNEHEARLLTDIEVVDEESALKASLKFLSKGIEAVLLTRGPRGIFLKNNYEVKNIKSFKVDAVDTTAAGDVFTGSLAAALSQGMKLSNAVEFANAAAAISVTRIGAQPSIPYKEEIEKFLRENKN